MKPDRLNEVTGSMLRRFFFLIICSVLIVGCESVPVSDVPTVDSPDDTPDYRIGPGDQIQIFVWRNAELTTSVPVRPDGKISTPLVEDMVAAGKTPTTLARDIEKELSTYVKSPVVTVIVTGFIGPFADQIRVVGEATSPRALPYRENMTLLDLMISTGGLTEFADGNNASLVRTIDGEQQSFKVRLYDLIKKGDITANQKVFPGDILIIPEALF